MFGPNPASVFESRSSVNRPHVFCVLVICCWEQLDQHLGTEPCWCDRGWLMERWNLFPSTCWCCAQSRSEDVSLCDQWCINRWSLHSFSLHHTVNSSCFSFIWCVQNIITCLCVAVMMNDDDDERLVINWEWSRETGATFIQPDHRESVRVRCFCWNMSPERCRKETCTKNRPLCRFFFLPRPDYPSLSRLLLRLLLLLVHFRLIALSLRQLLSSSCVVPAHLSVCLHTHRLSLLLIWFCLHASFLFLLFCLLLQLLLLYFSILFQFFYPYFLTGDHMYSSVPLCVCSLSLSLRLITAVS